MCGIVGYIGKREAAPILVEGLRKLEYRGYDSAGVATLANGKLELRKCQGKLKALEELLKTAPVSGSVGIGHTRWATHGQPSDVNAHPHTDCTGTIAVAHNGILENYAALRKELAAKGHTFQSATDTEVFAHAIEEASKGGVALADAVQAAVKRFEGAYALAVVSSAAPGTVVAARLSNPPLLVGFGEAEMFVGSDVAALLDRTRRFVFIESGEIAVVTAAGATLRTFAGAPVDRAAIEVTWNAQTAEKGGFKHFMLKEIHEQPRVLADCLRGRLDDEKGDVSLAEVPLTDAQVKSLARVVFVACGTSYYASLLGRLYMERFTGLPSEADLGSEFRYRDAVVGPGTLVVAVSQSGETADTLAAVQYAKSKGATVVSVCNVVGSALARESDGTVYIHAGPEICVLSTKTFIGSVAALLLLALHLGRRKGTATPETVRAVISELRRLPQLMDRALTTSGEMDRWARLFFKREHFLFLGRGTQHAVALEGALKLKEVSYIHAEGYAGGEMKHGPIALIDENMPVVALVPQGGSYEKMLSNVEEVRAREGILLAVATEGDDRPGAHADAVVPVPAASDLLSPLLTIVPLQLLAYHIAVRRGCDVDQPRNLAKSVTVE